MKENNIAVRAEPDSSEKTIKKQRIGVVDEIEDLLTDVEATKGQRIGRVRQNINIARAEPLDDGEFDYCVRLALHQIDQCLEKGEDETLTLRENLDTLKKQLPEKAALPRQTSR